MHKAIFLVLLSAGCAAGFMSPNLASSPLLARRVSSPSVCLRMADDRKGFGKEGPQKQASEIAKDRAPAAARYEEIRRSGAPEFNVFFRKTGATDEEGLMMGGWYPVGLITAPSSQLVNRAIYNTEDALLQGAFRVHQKQIIRQFTTKDGKKVSNWKELKECDLEYGYQMKEFPDEDVVLAQKPKEPSEWEKMGGGLLKKIQDAVNWVPEEK